MKEKPILFSGEMVRALLEGRKTQTRRVVKPQPKMEGRFGVYADLYNRGPEWAFWLTDNRMTEPRTWKCPWAVGMKIWVRETFRLTDEDDGSRWVMYRANSEMRAPDGHFEGCLFQGAWRPSIFMPRWASRITLEVTGVRVQRVQEITDEDVKAEGVLTFAERYPLGELFFKPLWDSINAKRMYGWDSNPWVWAITFRKVDQEGGAR